jgi:L-alanine-DL-glutamate epimerase-like enolase superfamily enzyme
MHLSARAYTIPTDAPEADGTLAWSSTTLILVKATDGDTVGQGYTYGPTATTGIVTGLLDPAVREVDPDATTEAWLRMQQALRNAGRPGVAGLALSAADCAIWDLKARRHRLPLARLLGAARAEVPVYGSGGFTTYTLDQQQHQLNHWVHHLGIPRVKIKIGESWGRAEDRDLARMAAARKTIGEQAELYVDANGGYHHKQAIRVMRRAADLDVRWFEEPVSSDDLAGLSRVRDHVDADVTAGEYGYDLAYFARMAPHVDCLQVDVTRCGGITELLRIAAVAAAHGLDVSGHCAPHQHLPVLAAVPNLRHAEWFHDHVRIETMLFDGAIDPTEGTAPVNHATPGTGLTFRDSDADQFRVG